jgi:hypothetical protein
LVLRDLQILGEKAGGERIEKVCATMQREHCSRAPNDHRAEIEMMTGNLSTPSPIGSEQAKDENIRVYEEVYDLREIHSSKRFSSTSFRRINWKREKMVFVIPDSSVTDAIIRPRRATCGITS